MSKSNLYLLLLILFVTVSNLLWYFLGHKPLYWDSADHLSYSLETYKSFISGASWFHSLLDVSWYYPPFVYWTSIPFQMIFGRNELAGFFQITFFLILLITSVYKIGKKIYNEESGVFAAFCIAVFPIVNEYGRDYMLDLPLAAMVAAAVLSLVKTENFSRTGRSFQLGIILGLGMLTKWTFILFVLTPFVYYIFEGFKYTPKKSKVTLNLSLSVLVALAISLPWYVRNIIPILSNRLNELQRGNLSAVENIFYYLKIIPSQISIVVAVLILIGIIFFSGRSHFMYKRMPLYWLIGSYILISLISFKLPRFSIPLLIPLCILFSGMIFFGEYDGSKRNIFVKVFVIIAAVNFLYFSFSPYRVNFEIPGIGAPVLSSISPDKTNWKNSDVIKVINEDRIRDKKAKVNLRVLTPEENFNTSTLQYYSNLNNAPINILGAEGFPFFTDYIVELKSGKERHKESDLLPDTNTLYKTFKKLETFNIASDLEAKVYKRNQDANFDLYADSLKSVLTNSLGNFFIKTFKPADKPELEINFGDSASLFRGKIKSVKFKSDEAQLNKMIFRGIKYILNNDSAYTGDDLSVKNLKVALNDLEFNINSLIYVNRFEILSLKDFKIETLELNPDDIKSYIEKTGKGKAVTLNSAFNNNSISITGRYNYDYNFDILLSLSQGRDSNLDFRIDKFSFAGFAIPQWLTNYMLEKYNPVIKGSNEIERFQIGKFTVTDNKILIKE